MVEGHWRIGDRRSFVKGGVAATASLVLCPAGSIASAQAAYPTTIGVLQRTRDGEIGAYRRYSAFAKQAKSEGYPGIAYLFTALATAELTHGQNAERLLARLGVVPGRDYDSDLGMGDGKTTSGNPRVNPAVDAEALRSGRQEN